MITRISRQLEWESKHFDEIQNRTLLRILRKNAHTEYGKKYNFREIDSKEKFRKEVPFSEYADYKDFTGRLSVSQLKALQDYLEEYDQGKPRWWYLLRDWNEDEDHRFVSMSTPLPDYTLLISNQKLKW